MTTGRGGDLSRQELRRALEGHGPSMERLVAHLTPVIQARVARMVTRLARHLDRGVRREEVAELTQDVFLHLLDNDARTLRAWDPARGMSLRNFVGLVAGRHAAAQLTRKKKNLWNEEATADEDMAGKAPGASSPGDAEGEAISRELLELLLARLARSLTPLGLHLLELTFVQQLSVKEIAAQMEMSTDAVYAWRSRLSRQVAQTYEKILSET